MMRNGNKSIILVNNAISHDIDRMFSLAIIERKVIDKNKIKYVLNNDMMDFNTFHIYCHKHNI